MSRIIFMVGPTGSGKTTYRRERLSHNPCISPDDFIVGKWTPAKASSSWAHARNTFIEMLKEKEFPEIVVDAQFVSGEARREWVAIARGFCYDTHGLIFETPFRQMQENQRHRGVRGGYGAIPYAVLLKSYRSFRDQLRDFSLVGDFHSVTRIPWKKIKVSR